MAVSLVHLIPTHCWTCKKAPPSDTLFKTCGKCQSVYYCSRECQTGDWRRHKEACRTNSLQTRQVDNLTTQQGASTQLVSPVNSCAQCNKAPSREVLLKLCGRCQAVFYCSAICQKQHWKHHKTNCELPSQKSVALNAVAESKTEPAGFSPTITGFLRFFSIWLDLFKFQGALSNRTVWILGGGYTKRKGANQCPQLSELLRLLNNSTIMVFDNNPTVLEIMQSVDHAQATPHFSQVFNSNVKARKVAEEMQQVEKILEDESPRNNTVTFHAFEIGKDNPNKFPAADYIIATHSMMYPMDKLRKGSQDARIQLVSQYIGKLKKGGLLYMDSQCFQHLCEKPGDDSESIAGREEIFKPKRTVEVIQKITDHSGISITLHLLEPILGVALEDRYYVLQDDASMVQTTAVFALERIT